MKLSFAFAASFALAAPVLAQPPASRTDWTKPVTGVDAPVPANVEDRTLPITVDLISKTPQREMTAEEVEQYVREQGLWSTRVRDLDDSVLPVEVIDLSDFPREAAPDGDTPKPPPCEPPVVRQPSSAELPPPPCPEAPR